MNRSTASHGYPAALRECASRLQRGDLGGAEALCRRLLRVAPDEPEALHLFGLIAHRNGDAASARARLERAVARRPDVARFHNSLGLVQREAGDPEAARQALSRAVELRPGFAGAWYNLGLAHEDRGDYPAALEAFEAACRHAPDLAPAHHARGLVLQVLGRLEDACAAYREALSLNPRFAEAHFHLAHARRAERADDTQLASIEALLAERDWPPREEAWLQSAVGKLRDDIGDNDRAFRAYARANRVSAPPHDPDARDDLVARLERSFTRRRLCDGTEAALERADRIFIAGPPRSGTTLLEAMLAAHPDVAAGGERKELVTALAELARDTGLSDPDAWASADPETLRRAAAELDRHLAPAGDTARLTDKLPGNVWHLGFVGLLMPRAPVLLALRDARDVGLSCFFTRFEEGHSFSYDLYHCGRYIRAVRRLMDHWLEALPNPVMAVSYERLVSAPEATIREVHARCGLAQTGNQSDHVAAATTVNTASSWQVRQGIYRGSLGRWRNYEPHLGPLLEGLGNLTAG